MEYDFTSTAELPVFLKAPRALTKVTVEMCSHVGRFGMMLVELVRALPDWRQWFPRTVEQCLGVGYGSLFIVLVTAGFAGAVTSLQAGYQTSITISRCQVFCIGYEWRR